MLTQNTHTFAALSQQKKKRCVLFVLFGAGNGNGLFFPIQNEYRAHILHHNKVQPNPIKNDYNVELVLICICRWQLCVAALFFFFSQSNLNEHFSNGIK